MAAYISVPRDLTKVKSKVAFNLTKRQLVCFGTAALIGVPLFFVLRDSGGNTVATLGMMAIMLPAFFLGMYEKNGQPLEKLLSHYVQARFLRQKIRPYQTNNYYALLMFRHTFVSILLSNPEIGVATVAAEAGHAQPSTTLAIYTQVYDKRRKEIRNQMSKELYE